MESRKWILDMLLVPSKNNNNNNNNNLRGLSLRSRVRSGCQIGLGVRVVRSMELVPMSLKKKKKKVQGNDCDG